MKSKKCLGRAAIGRIQRRLQKQAVEQGIPEFVLRLLDAREVCLTNLKPTLRYRHD
jgi:hypothetical protein